MNVDRKALITTLALITMTATGCGTVGTTAIVAGTLVGSGAYAFYATRENAQRRAQRERQREKIRVKAKQREEKRRRERAEQQRKRKAKQAGIKRRDDLLAQHVFAESCKSLSKRLKDAVMRKGYTVMYKQDDKYVSDWKWHTDYRSRYLVTLTRKGKGCQMEPTIVYVYNDSGGRTGSDFKLQYSLLAATEPKAAEKIDKLTKQATAKALEKLEKEADEKEKDDNKKHEPRVVR